MEAIERFIENLVRWCTPGENTWAFVLLAGFFCIVVAYLWMTIAMIFRGGGTSGYLIAFAVIAVLLTLATGGLIYVGDPAARWPFLGLLGTMALFVPASVILGIVHFKQTRRPLILFILGALLCATPFLYTHAVEPIIFRMFRPPWIARVDGELNVTLTGIDGFDYARLGEYADAVVLQMANSDVTDATLEQLRSFKLLRELDLNDTQVTDAGLATLKNCASLEKIRLKNTKITDAGFREQVMSRDWITDVDVRGTEVASKTLRRWKSEREGRNFLK